MHTHTCVSVSFILALALSGVTSAPYAAPGLTQYAHTDEDHPKPELLESQRCKCHTRAHTHTHPIPLFVLQPLLYPLPFVFAISVISHFACVFGLCAQVCVTCL